MLEQTTVNIGGDDIVIESLPATAALQLLTKTVRIVGGAGKGLKDFPSSKEELARMGKDLSESLHLGSMIEGLIDRLDSTEFPNLIKETVKASLPLFRDRVKKGEGSFDDWFENRFSKDLKGLFQLLFEIYKYNYGEPMEWIMGFFKASQIPMEEAPDPGSPPAS